VRVEPDTQVTRHISACADSGPHMSKTVMVTDKQINIKIKPELKQIKQTDYTNE